MRPLLLFWALVAAGDPIVPRAIRGWEVRTRPALELRELERAEAPSLPAWNPHGSGSTGSRDLDARQLMSVLESALARVNDHLSEAYSGSFRLWIFEGVPYAARTEQGDVIVSTRALDPERRHQLPCIVAHEIHHLALLERGFASIPAGRERVLLALLAEGAATRMCADRFPELRSISEGGQLEEAFRQVRVTLDAASLFQHQKWGHRVGYWMVRKIEEQRGRTAWLDLLGEPPPTAARRFLQLYLETGPSPEYRF